MTDNNSLATLQGEPRGHILKVSKVRSRTPVGDKETVGITLFCSLARHVDKCREKLCSLWWASCT